MDRSSELPRNVELGALGQAMLEAARAAHIGVVVTVQDGGRPRNIYVNDAIIDLLGRSAEELLRADPVSMVAPSDRQFLEQRLRVRSSGDMGQTSYDIAAIRPDGGRVWLEVTSSGVKIDGRNAVLAFVVDVTKRKLAEDSRNQTEARFRELIEKGPEPIAIIRDGFFVYANAAFVSALGYPNAAAVCEVPLSAHVPGPDYPLLKSRMRLLRDGHAKLSSQVYRCRRMDGSTVLIEASSVPLDYEGLPSILTMGRDVTERRTLEARLVQADRLAALGTMAAGVAHEINNPLAYLMLNLDWISRKLSEGAQPSSLEGLTEMLLEARRGAERVATIVRELRSFSRADGETRRRVDVVAVVASAIRMTAHEVRHRARVVTSLSPVRPIWANEARIEQVVLNLILNAAQAMPEQRSTEGEIQISVRSGDGERVIVEVADNAGGIAPEVLPRIFDPFFTTKPAGIGTGLGLSICHGIVGSVGGQITVHSEQGVGTTFRVVLPAGTAEMEASEDDLTGHADSSTSGVRRARVLVVDDEVQIAATMRELLAPEHDVVATTSGEGALAAVREGSPFDIIFCDLMMPGMSGIDLFEQLRRESSGLERRVVFMTGGAFTARAAEFLASVDNRRIEKPFSLGFVERMVREMRGQDR